MAPDISVIVPTYNRRAGLERLLTSLAAQTHRLTGFEVIVIDDGSTDGTSEFLRDVDVPYELRILEQAHQGPAQARNLGVAHAAAPLVLFLDDDVLPAPALIALHLGMHSTGGPRAVVTGPMKPPHDWKRSPWVRWEEEKLLHQYEAMEAGRFTPSARNFFTANSSLGRELFTAAGGFDASFKRAEDVELGYRLRNAGARFMFVPQASVLHYASRTFRAWRRTPYQYGKYDVIMSRDKGHEALELALSDFHRRHILNRSLSTLLTGRPWLVNPGVALACLVVHVSAMTGATRVASRALSALFNLLYWQGVCEELGGRRPLFGLLAVSHGRPAAHRALINFWEVAQPRLDRPLTAGSAQAANTDAI